LTAGQKRVRIGNVTGIQLDGDAFVHVQHNNAGGSGRHKLDFFRIDKDGNVDSTTPILHDFDTITHLYIYPIDKETLTVKGGEFVVKKRAMTQEELANYTEANRYMNGIIAVERHKTVLDGIRYVRNEGELVGTRSIRFMSLRFVSNVTVQNCVFTPQIPARRYGTSSNVGAYGIAVWNSLDVELLNCEQTESITDNTFWGVITTGYTKNIVGDNLTFNRFPSHHTSNHNPITRNSTIGVFGSQANGTGLFLIENSTVHSQSIVLIAGGSIWNGAIIIKNCELHTNSSVPSVVYHQFAGQTDVVYKIPPVTIDGLRVTAPNSANDAGGLSIFWSNQLPANHTVDAPEEIFVRDIIRNEDILPFRIGTATRPASEGGGMTTTVHDNMGIKIIDIEKKK
jgi:hypothetical protein